MDVGYNYCGFKFCGQKVFLESTGDREIDAAFRSTFWDNFHHTAPLEMGRDDVKTILAYMKGEIKAKQPCSFEAAHG